MKIIFMGTPDFAVASLSALVEAGFNIVSVITAPDKPAGRGQKINESAVKKYAVEHNIPVLQPIKLKDPDFIEELKAYAADLQVVVAFRMLPEIVWNMPPMGTINLHGSLLPQYRGAAPINWAIINGETETGATTFFLQHEIDTGDILFSDKMPILNRDTAGDVHDKLMILGADLLVKTVKAIESGDYKEIPQHGLPVLSSDNKPTAADITSSNALKHAPKIFKEDCEIKWDQPVAQVYNLIRGLSPYPTAFTYLQEKTLKVFKVEINYDLVTIKPGEFLTDSKTFLKFGCKDGYILLKDLQLEGKKRMPVDEFLRGVRL
jgi:methionyl-tRNA formyltransferase